MNYKKNNFIKPVRIYYKMGKYVLSLSSEKQEEMTVEKKNERDLLNYKYFKMLKGHEKNLEGLRNSYKEFIENNKELEQEDINYTRHKDDTHASYYTLMEFSKNDLEENINFGYDMFDEININEFNYYELCNNGMLSKLDKKYIGKTVKVFGKDFSSFYPNMMTHVDFKIPIKEGKLSKITDLKKALKFGIYRVQIVCNDENFRKIFVFSEDNTYTHYCLNFCLKNKKKFNIDFNVLDLDKEHNCLTYEKEQLVDANKIFKTWFNKLSKLKTKYPKNKLVKQLFSSVWGTMTKYNRKYIMSDEELANLEISNLDDKQDTQYKLIDYSEYVDKNFNIKTKYIVLDTKKPYSYKWRMKPFLSSFCRRFMAEFILNNIEIDDVIRIYCDSLCLLKDYDFSNLKYFPINEDKTTGTIHFKNVIDCKKV